MSAANNSRFHTQAALCESLVASQMRAKRMRPSRAIELKVVDDVRSDCGSALEQTPKGIGSLREVSEQ